MAKSTTTVILVLTIIAAHFAITTTARPCKTIFFITTTSTTTFPNQNPQNPNHLTFFITEIHQFHRHHHHRPIFPDQFPQHDVVSTKSVDSSLKDRTIDIMSIVGSLLFGVGCGAFTAAVMYSIWYYCSDRTDDEEDFDSDEEEFDDVEGNKNGDYVAVANAEKEVPPTADEVDAMKK
nr:hypothetical protein [Tanacetum cinerariifolium]